MTIEYVAMGAKPDPFNFSIVKYESIGGGTIVLANYKGCKTYGGNKLMLLRGFHDPSKFESLDPHFLEGHLVVARFEPTNYGWKLARTCSESLAKEMKY